MKLSKTYLGVIFVFIVIIIGLLVYSELTLRNVRKMYEKNAFDEMEYIENINRLKYENSLIDTKVDTLIIKEIEIKKIMDKNKLEYEKNIDSINNNNVADDIELFSKYTR